MVFTCLICVSTLLILIFQKTEGDGYSSSDQLVFVHVLFRHGIRSPIHLMPKDIFNHETSWQQGLGELQLEGMRQMYDLGKQLRRIYVNERRYLSESYNTDEVYFRSTDVNRTLMSALCVAAGLYGNKGWMERNWPVAWQPMPIHTWPVKMDSVLSEEIEACPRLKEMNDALATSHFAYAMYAHNKDLFQYLASVSGFVDLHPANMSRVFDNLRCELVTHSHSWPRWVNTSIYEKVERLAHLYTMQQFSDVERIRLTAGNLLKDVLDRMHDQPVTVSGNSNRLKFFAYSGHDSNIISLLAAFGLLAKSEFLLPDFASCILLELWQNDGIGRHVKVSYRPNSTSPYGELFLPACGRPCKLQSFDALMRRFMTENHDVECGLRRSRVEDVLKFLIAGLSLTIFILLTVVIILLSLLFQRRQTKYESYYPGDTTVLHRLLDENSSESEFSSLDAVDINR